MLGPVVATAVRRRRGTTKWRVKCPETIGKTGGILS